MSSPTINFDVGVNNKSIIYVALAVVITTLLVVTTVRLTK